MRSPLKPSIPALFAGLTSVVIIVILFKYALNGLSPVSRPENDTEANSKISFGLLVPNPVGDPPDGKPWITHVTTRDLDNDGLLEIIACDARDDTIRLLRRDSSGEWRERVIGEPIKGPVHVDFADVDSDGDTDLLVAAMGIVLPNRAKTGKVAVLENLGDLKFRNHIVLDETDRVTDLRGGDFDRDGDIDLVAGQFGYDQGAIRWLEQVGPFTFKPHDLLAKSGTIHCIVDDVDRDGDLDILALVSQEWEEVYCFLNDGSGHFTPRILWGSTNQDYGSSGLASADLDRDGDMDLLYSNGDGFDYTNPGPRPWHGVQWLENRGNGYFARKNVGLMAGAFSPVAIDIDQDGDLDIVASSCCNEWGAKDAYSMVCFENLGNQKFAKRPLATSPTHIVSIHAADLDEDGYKEIVSGGFHAYPPWNDMSRLLIWDKID